MQSDQAPESLPDFRKQDVVAPKTAKTTNTRFRQTEHDPLNTTRQYHPPGIRLFERPVADGIFSHDRKRCGGLVRPGTLIGGLEKPVCFPWLPTWPSHRDCPLSDPFVLVCALLEHLWPVSDGHQHGHSFALVIIFGNLCRTFFNGSYVYWHVYYHTAFFGTDAMGFPRIYPVPPFRWIPLGTPWPHTT